jgi:xylan 1,4-beta-xylosidase
VHFVPTSFHQMAGLAAYYGTRAHAYLHVSADADGSARVLRLMVVRNGVPTEPEAPLPLSPSGPVHLGLDINHGRMQFRYSLDGQQWSPFGPSLATDFLSDEFACQQVDGFFHSFGFTGNFIALACQDLATRGEGQAVAEFSHFDYRGLV